MKTKLIALLISITVTCSQAFTLYVTNMSDGVEVFKVYNPDLMTESASQDIGSGFYTSFEIPTAQSFTHLWSDTSGAGVPLPNTTQDWGVIYFGPEFEFSEFSPIAVPEPSAQSFFIYAAGVVVAFCLTRQLKQPA